MKKCIKASDYSNRIMLRRYNVHIEPRIIHN